MGTRDFLFFGHRTSGKSTLARELKDRGWEVLDIDQLIEERFNTTCADLIAQDEVNFRKIEVQITHALSDDTHESPRIIVCGGGLESFPNRPIGVWISRDGWEQSASEQRSRLRPDWPFEREIEWMKQTREPRFQKAADLHLHIPRGRGVNRCADELEDLMRWIDGPSPVVAPRSYMVLPEASLLERAEARVQRLGLAGLEIRSDLAPNARPKVPTLASLRTEDASWLLEFPNSPWDIDVEFLDEVLNAKVFDLEPRRLILSAHPNSMSDFAYLQDAQKRLPKLWQPLTELKFAPQCELDEILPLPSAETFIPQGKNLAWIRHVLCQKNRVNYLPLGLAEHHGGTVALPPLDLQDWLAFWSLAPAASYDALLGEPVIQSQGDWWHRRASIAEGQNRGYLKIPCTPEAFLNTLNILRELGIHNLSITSPLKALAGDVCGHDTPLNTMRWDKNGHKWTGMDTDAAGMRAALLQAGSHCEGQPRHAVILGTGAVTPAIQRALTDANWSFEEVPGRSQDSIPKATLLINATGRPVCRPHQSIIQLDLHYSSVEPSSAPVHLNGDVFFAAQAAEQRLFWFQGV